MPRAEREAIRLFLLSGPDNPEGDRPRTGGDDGTRTHDPLVANQVLYQLSYVPDLSHIQRTATENNTQHELSFT